MTNEHLKSVSRFLIGIEIIYELGSALSSTCHALRTACSEG
jgi:hypothetical protein